MYRNPSQAKPAATASTNAIWDGLDFIQESGLTSGVVSPTDRPEGQSGQRSAKARESFRTTLYDYNNGRPMHAT